MGIVTVKSLLYFNTYLNYPLYFSVEGVSGRKYSCVTANFSRKPVDDLISKTPPSKSPNEKDISPW